jgi:hypothetical protein
MSARRPLLGSIVAVALALFSLASVLVIVPPVAAATQEGDGAAIDRSRPARTFRVGTAARFQRAVTRARPGDTIVITRTIHQPLNYNGDKDGPAPGMGRHGLAGRPITITAEPGVWIDPGNVSNGDAALDITFVNHVHVVGVRVRNSQFGIRFINAEGTSAAPLRLSASTITTIGEIGLAVIGDYIDFAPTRHLVVEGNTISETGKKAGFGEGIYIGNGGHAWVDLTSDIVIRDNEIFHVPSEAIDIKPATRRITVEGNRIHDLWPHHSAAIMAIYTNGAPNPEPDVHSEIVVRDNRIWNVNLADVPEANDRAIWVGHGGVEVTGNLIWGMRDNQAEAEAIVVYSPAPFGPHPVVIRDNVLWSRGGMEVQSGDARVDTAGNVGPRGSANVRVVRPGFFVGPVPDHGVASTADAGSGPGSAFMPRG